MKFLIATGSVGLVLSILAAGISIAAVMSAFFVRFGEYLINLI